ncbi:hypothetical protein L1987_12556 [Smallanthus sonchifolius]|uniref:Uncharacterized protein n=1 Tax=Smallanthus sonchifolius TaxID=185202 RepID=A0ACB9JE43_9ASTR|nr:hypothetical protein L1987_12556 [Smallanthus sonchifolius]
MAEDVEKGDHLLVKPDVLEEPPGAYYSRLMDTNAQLWYIIREYISNSEIVSFLQQNAHPRVAERMPSVLENVMDQDAFEAACNFAREFSSLLCEDSKKMRLIVKTEIYGHMKDFLSHQK